MRIEKHQHIQKKSAYYLSKSSHSENVQPQPMDHFVFPVTRREKKIYLVAKNGLIHYVGITRQSMRSRIRIGVKPDNKSGYHGYKWLKEDGDHCLIIWTFKNDTNVEAIEAEIVYFFRKQHGKWPQYQMEIHFHPSSENERLLANKILKESQKIVCNFTSSYQFLKNTK
ncbi:MAG: hypothetical protein ABIH78_02060 [Candidatus Peregrinibacteria bacterium]